MLNKKTLVIGMTVRVIDIKANTAGVYHDDCRDLLRGGISLYALDKVNEVEAVVTVGGELTITKLPRKVHGVNLCRVKTKDGFEGEVFWTELRSNCVGN